MRAPVVFVVEEPDGSMLPSEDTLADFLPPGKRMVALHMCSEEEKLVRIVGSNKKPVKMSISSRRKKDTGFWMRKPLHRSMGN